MRSLSESRRGGSIEGGLRNVLNLKVLGIKVMRESRPSAAQPKTKHVVILSEESTQLLPHDIMAFMAFCSGNVALSRGESGIRWASELQREESERRSLSLSLSLSFFPPSSAPFFFLLHLCVRLRCARVLCLAALTAASLMADGS